MVFKPFLPSRKENGGDTIDFDLNGDYKAPLLGQAFAAAATFVHKLHLGGQLSAQLRCGAVALFGTPISTFDLKFASYYISESRIHP